MRVMPMEYLILSARYSQDIVYDCLIPDIEKNCAENGVYCPRAYEVWKNNIFPPNSMYFCHSYAEYAIPIGEEYDKIALVKDFELRPNTIQNCHAKMICFFTAYKIQPNDTASEGHREISLIQFVPQIPQIIYDELHEVTKSETLVSYPAEILLFKSKDIENVIANWKTSLTK